MSSNTDAWWQTGRQNFHSRNKIATNWSLASEAIRIYAPNRFLLCRALSHHPGHRVFCVPAALRRSPSGNSRNLQCSPHLGLAQSGRFVPQFRVLPFCFTQAGFHAVHPTGELPNVVLIACPLGERSLELTERYLQGQQSTLRSLVSAIPGWCVPYPLHPQEVCVWARTALGLGCPGWLGQIKSGSLASIASGSQGQLNPGQQVESGTGHMKPGVRNQAPGDTGKGFRAQPGEVQGVRLLWS